MKRNGAVDVCKFLCSIVIALFHFSNSAPRVYFPHGNIGVEFFVLVSGVYFFYGWERMKRQRAGTDMTFYPYEFAKKRFWRFFPYTTTAFLLSFLVIRLYIQRSYKKGAYAFVNQCAESLWEVLLIGKNGMVKGTFLNGPVWTVSAMFLAEVFLICILVRWEKAFCACICPATVLIGFAVWRNIESANNEVWMGFTTFGAFRVFLLTCLAYFCYCLVNRLKAVRLTFKGVLALSVCEAACFALLFLMVLYPESRPLRYAGILLLCTAITILISEQSFSAKLFPDSPWTRYLGELSFAIYLTHWTIRQYYFYRYGAEEACAHPYSYIFAVLAVSVVFLVLVKRLIQGGRALSAKYMAEMVENESITPSDQNPVGVSDNLSNACGSGMK